VLTVVQCFLGSEELVGPFSTLGTSSYKGCQSWVVVLCGICRVLVVLGGLDFGEMVLEVRG